MWASFIITILKVAGLFLLWTLLVYLMHRLAHFRHRFNFLYHIHRYHHRVNYLSEKKGFRWYHFFFYFGSFYESLDVWLMMTLPAIALFLWQPKYGIYILVFHYLYEVFLSESQLDHNERITGKVTRYFSWGTYHLGHHRNIRSNFSLMITLWDSVFRTTQQTD
ncbi:MAG: hypothetical protein JWQ79_3172 [Mucilaginibacter sp.]|nr:hypothetical protein [Mucilaginibacter sp.]